MGGLKGLKRSFCLLCRLSRDMLSVERPSTRRFWGLGCAGRMQNAPSTGPDFSADWCMPLHFDSSKWPVGILSVGSRTASNAVTLEAQSRPFSATPPWWDPAASERATSDGPDFCRIGVIPCAVCVSKQKTIPPVWTLSVGSGSCRAILLAHIIFSHGHFSEGSVKGLGC